MPRPLRLLLLSAALLALAAAPAGAARLPIRVGMGDQNASMFDSPDFQAARFARVRYFIPWDAAGDPVQLQAAQAYVQRARRDGISVLLHISTDDLTPKRARLPSVAQYRSAVGRLVRTFRAQGVRDFGTWNEANHVTQPTYRSPARAAAYFRELYRLVKPSCPGCAVVALDVLDQTGVERYEKAFFAALSPTYRRRATVVGIHNYGDVNRGRTTFTRNIIHLAHRSNRSTTFWFTETGGLVEFGRNFPCNTTRAAHRLRNVFSLARRYRTSGVRRIYLYNWTGAGCDARFDAGLTSPSGTPRAAYRTLRALLPGYLR